MRIYVNRNLSPGKAAAAAVHAALNAYGIDHGRVVVLEAGVAKIERESLLYVSDAGTTEVAPGTTTAGFIEFEEED